MRDGSPSAAPACCTYWGRDHRWGCVTVDPALADRIAWAVVKRLRANVTVAENMWREQYENQKRYAETAWELVRRAAPFVNAVLCMTIDRFRAEGKTAPALEWIAEAGIAKDEKTEGERMAREIQKERDRA